MPNHITNNVRFHGNPKRVKEAMDSLFADGHVDFNRVIPQPENIFNESISSDEKKRLDQLGIPNWLDWNRPNWGTKWNAYSTERKDDGSVSFQTAWSTPMPIWEKLAAMHPDVTMEVRFADEDTHGSNMGVLIGKGGELFTAIDHDSLSNSVMFAEMITGGQSEPVVLNVDKIMKESLECELEYRDYEEGESLYDAQKELLGSLKTKASDLGEMSDGYHTFNELYQHRHALFAALIGLNGGWKSLQHHDPDFPMFDGHFIAGAELPTGQVSYHLPMSMWDDFPAEEMDRPPPFDGHTPDDVVSRLINFAKDKLVK